MACRYSDRASTVRGSMSKEKMTPPYQKNDYFPDRLGLEFIIAELNGSVEPPSVKVRTFEGLLRGRLADERSTAIASVGGK